VIAVWTFPEYLQEEVDFTRYGGSKLPLGEFNFHKGNDL
jgi:hypothetical protein